MPQQSAPTHPKVYYIVIKYIPDPEIIYHYEEYLQFILDDKDKNLVANKEIGDKEYFITFVDCEKISRMLELFKDYRILISHQEISESVLMVWKSALNSMKYSMKKDSWKF